PWSSWSGWWPWVNWRKGRRTSTNRATHCMPPQGRGRGGRYKQPRFGISSSVVKLVLRSCVPHWSHLRTYTTAPTSDRGLSPATERDRQRKNAEHQTSCRGRVLVGGGTAGLSRR